MSKVQTPLIKGELEMNTNRTAVEVISRIISPVVFIVLCTYILVTTRGISVRAFRYPRSVTLILLVLSLIELFMVTANLQKPNMDRYLSERKKHGYKNVVIAIGLFFLYIFALDIVGFYIPTYLIVLSYMVLMGAGKYYKYLAIIPAGAVLFIYLVFQKLLNVPIR